MKNFIKVISYLILAIILSIPFNFLGIKIADFLITFNTTKSFILSLLVSILMALVLIVLFIAFLYGLLLIDSLEQFTEEFKLKHEKRDYNLIGFGWFFCLNIYFIIKQLVIKYPTNNIINVFDIISNIVFACTIISYLLFIIFKFLKLVKKFNFNEWLHYQKNMKKSHKIKI